MVGAHCMSLTHNVSIRAEDSITAKTLLLMALGSLHSELRGFRQSCLVLLGMVACTVNCTCMLRTKTSEVRNVAWPELPDNLDSLN